MYVVSRAKLHVGQDEGGGEGGLTSQRVAPESH